jgi:hypothetical protein
MNSGVYFVRDDDIGDLTDALVFFVELFVSRRIPVSYQIIPARLTEECAEYLLGVQRAHPDLIEFGQHGLRHCLELPGGRMVKREFGPERSAQQQFEDILEGKRLLDERLKGAPVKVFTPPQHKYNRDTVAAAAKAGHRVFSAADYATGIHQFVYSMGRSVGLSSIQGRGISYNGAVRPEAEIFERSISIAVDNGRSISIKPDDLEAKVRRARRKNDAVGFMLHHACYDRERGALTKIADRMAGLGAQDFVKLGDLAPA